MRFIDAFLSGTAAARPSAATLANGVFYYSTDTGNLARVDAAAWVTYLNVGGDVVGPASATANAPALFDGITGKLLKEGVPYVVGPGTVADGDPVAFDGTSGNLLKVGTPPSGGGAVEFIESISVAGSAVTTIDFSSTLDGDTDGNYIIQGSVVDPVVGLAATIDLRPNTLTTNMASRYSGQANGVGALGPSDTTTMLMAVLLNVAGVAFFEALFRAKSGTRRQIISHAAFTGATRYGFSTCGGGWSDTSTNVTSLRIACGTANGLGIGSTFKLYKRQDA